jgi:hypothetical protein
MGNIYHNTGNVGIGTVSPQVPLDVRGGSVRVDPSGAFEQSVAFSSGVGGWARGLFWVDGTATGSLSGRTGGLVMSGEGSIPNRLSIGWGSDPWSTTNGIHLLTSGNCGVGTSSPTARLDVNGGVNISGVLTVNETSGFTASGEIKCTNIQFTDSSHTGVGVSANTVGSGLRFGSPWADYSATDFKVRVMRYGKIVVVTGLARTPSAISTASSVIIKGLPIPRYRQEFTVMRNANILGVNSILKTGDLIAYNTFAASDWLSVNCAYIAE